MKTLIITIVIIIIIKTGTMQCEDAAPTRISLNLVPQLLDARTHARLAEYAHSIKGGAPQAAHGPQDALRQRLTRALKDHQ